MTIRVHIEEIRIDGSLAGRRRSSGLRSAIERSLADSLSADAASYSGGGSPELRTKLADSSTGPDLGTRIGVSLGKALGS